MHAHEQEPAIAAQFFPEKINQVRRFVASLTFEGEQRGLIGPREVDRLWSRHILNCAAIAPAFSSGRVADIGSGGGLPGVVLALARPDIDWVLIEPMERRVQWLEEQKKTLNISNVAVVRARAQDYPQRGTFDAVTARAVSALQKLIPFTAPLVHDGGELVLIKGMSAQEEITKAAKQIRQYKLSDVRVEIFGEDTLAEATRVVHATVRA